MALEQKQKPHSKNLTRNESATLRTDSGVCEKFRFPTKFIYWYLGGSSEVKKLQAYFLVHRSQRVQGICERRSEAWVIRYLPSEGRFFTKASWTGVRICKRGEVRRAGSKILCDAERRGFNTSCWSFEIRLINFSCSPAARTSRTLWVCDSFVCPVWVLGVPFYLSGINTTTQPPQTFNDHLFRV